MSHYKNGYEILRTYVPEKFAVAQQINRQINKAITSKINHHL
jgi:hypothetical protein